MPCSIKSRTFFIGTQNIWTPRWVQQVYCRKVLKNKEFLCFSARFIIKAQNKWMLLSYCEQFAILSLNMPVFQHWLKRWWVHSRCIFCRWLMSSAVNETATTQRFNGNYETSSLPLSSASSHYSFLPARWSCSPSPPPHWPFTHVRICSDDRKVKGKDAGLSAQHCLSQVKKVASEHQSSELWFCHPPRAFRSPPCLSPDVPLMGEAEILEGMGLPHPTTRRRCGAHGGIYLLFLLLVIVQTGEQALAPPSSLFQQEVYIKFAVMFQLCFPNSQCVFLGFLVPWNEHSEFCTFLQFHIFT